jgi:DNA-binding NarL/FixJ family response regulator
MQSCPVDAKVRARLTADLPASIRCGASRRAVAVARGKTSADIAKITGLSKRTIYFHLEKARVKLRVATRTEAVLKAVIGRLIEP